MIDKVITSRQKPDDMEVINDITGLEFWNTDNWCDKGEFEEYPELEQFVEKEELNALKEGKADYIAFRIDY